MRIGDNVEYECGLFVVEQIRGNQALVHRDDKLNDIRVVDMSKFELDPEGKNKWSAK